MVNIILDRDGVINADSDAFIKSLDEWRPLPGSLEAIARLSQAGYAVHVATNQSGIWRGLLSEATLQSMHDLLCRQVNSIGGEIASIRYCPHGPEQDCCCRKPRPGMYLAAATEFGFELDGVPIVGDSLRDLEAAAAVSAKPILVLTGKGRRTLDAGGLPSGTLVFDDLAAVAEAMLAEPEKFFPS